MGVSAAFEVGEFDKIVTDGNLKVSGIKHKSVIEVTKDGTTGVAATGKLHYVEYNQEEVPFIEIHIFIK